VTPTGTTGSTGTTPTTVVIPTRAARAIRVPATLAVPMVPVVLLAVEIVVVMAAVSTPVVTPTRVPPLAGAPVIVGQRPGKGFGDARRTQTSKAKACGEGSRGRDSLDSFHLVLAPRTPGRPNISLSVFLMNSYELTWY
jgi:hypothetical protein